jgi:hypothetical protein
MNEQEEGRIGRDHRRRYEEAINSQSGTPQPEAARQAEEAVKPAKPKKGVLDTIKDYFSDDDKPEDPKATNQRRDADLASAVGAMYLNAPGSNRMYADLTSNENPAAMVGVMAAKAALRAREQLGKRDMAVDDTVWAAENGVLEDLLDEAFSNSKAYTGLEPDEQMFQTAYSAAISTLKNTQGQQGPKQPTPQPSALRGVA